MTLTFYAIRAIIDVNPHTKYGFNPTNTSQVITQNVRSWPNHQPTYLPTFQRTYGHYGL